MTKKKSKEPTLEERWKDAEEKRKEAKKAWEEVPSEWKWGFGITLGIFAFGLLVNLLPESEYEKCLRKYIGGVTEDIHYVVIDKVLCRNEYIAKYGQRP